ncbi:hypothetical protein Q3G72_008631 [Acer saccharum]|nr:hypothetical protein Q3G72_008631 [Acer saccharum]
MTDPLLFLGFSADKVRGLVHDGPGQEAWSTFYCKTISLSEFQKRPQNGSLRWYKKHAYLRRCANDQSVPTHPVRINGFGTSTEFSTSLSNSVAVKGSEYPQKSSHVSWWSNHYKDLFASASGISRYPYKTCSDKSVWAGTRKFYQAVLLSNVYASVGRFQDAEAVRSKNLFVLTGIVEYETYHLALVITEYSSFLDGILLNLAVSFLFREENAEKTAWIWSRNDIWWLQNHQLSHQTS